ncbi:MAG: hypothetical protein FJ255_07975 [Phycisphaerae bacterium]|nr:hypothetical protein [Phycisphaerae bacterium]
MFQLKTISRESIPRALTKAERYRLLNEPAQAESICRDVLAIDPANHDALVCLILALTEMFVEVASARPRVDEALALVLRLGHPFDRLYYEGMVHERWARALVHAGYPTASVSALFEDAMRCFEEAQPQAGPGNNDAVLRWNACVRFMEHHHVEPPEDEGEGPVDFDDEMPVR